ncbi:MAG: hypothetical protein ABH884_00765 [Candidatus Komeilibacteria bacterium]
MKKYMTGFVPVQFNKVGKVLLTLGIISLLLEILDYFSDWFNLPNIIMFIGVGFVLIGLYLIYIVPKE